MVWLVVVAIVVLVVGAAVEGEYNPLVRARRNFQNAHAQTDVQLTHRLDLIPNPVEAARARPRHEQAALAALPTATARRRARRTDDTGRGAGNTVMTGRQ